MEQIEEIWFRIRILLSRLTHFQKRNRIRRYGLPIILVSLIFFLKHFFHQLLGDNSAFLMVSFIVAVSSWYGGLGPGIFATLLSAILTFFVFLQTDIAYHPMLGDFILTGIFIVEGLIISIVSEARFEMEEQKDEFIAFVAHELKNPLASVLGFSNLITIKATNKRAEKIASYGESITDSANRMLTLINELLDITKIEVGKFTYTDSFFNMADLAKEVITHQQVIAKDRTIVFKGKSKQTLYGDGYRITQVITNLLTNALKYSSPTKQILLRLKDTKKSVLLSIKDQGLGIAEKDQKKIFNRFFRTNEVQTNKSEGLGLGLFICSQIVQYHKGKLWVESKIGIGSTFFLELPLKIDRAKSQSKGRVLNFVGLL